LNTQGVSREQNKNTSDILGVPLNSVQRAACRNALGAVGGRWSWRDRNTARLAASDSSRYQQPAGSYNTGLPPRDAPQRRRETNSVARR
jgi:hypothetical protein